MLLKMKTTLPLTLLIIGSQANAHRISPAMAGQYILQSGPAHLCQDFALSSADVNAKYISLGGNYSFETINSNHDIESDIDPSCEFKEQNRREISEDVTVLTRVNEEFCRGTLRSRTLSTATLRLGQITIQHEVGGAPAYICVWKKR